MINIYRNNDETIVCQLPDENADLDQELMGKDEVSIDLVTDSILPIRPNDYIRVDGNVYRLNREPEVAKKSDVEYSYSFLFEGYIYELLDKVFINPMTNQSKFTLTGTLRDFLDMLVGNISLLYSGWKIGSIPNTERKNIVFDSLSCREVLNKLKDEFKLEYYLTDKTINYTDRVMFTPALTLKQGKGNGLYSIEQQNIDSEDTITRAYIYGGTQNLPPARPAVGDHPARPPYRNGEERLRIEERFLQNTDEYHKIVEKDVFFDDVFPRFEGTVESVEGDFDRIIHCSKIDFNITEHAIGGTTVKINFLTGDLMGIPFELNPTQDAQGHSTIINLVRKEDETALPDEEGKRPLIPNDLRKVKVGDKFNFTDIIMPDSYVTAAEAELREKGRQWLDFYKQLRVKYKLNIDHRKLRKDKITLGIGKVIKITAPDNEIPKSLRIVSLNRHLKTGKISCEVSNYDRDKWDDKKPIWKPFIMDGKLTWTLSNSKMDSVFTTEIMGKDGKTPLVSLNSDYKLTVDGKEVGESLKGATGDTGLTWKPELTSLGELRWTQFSGTPSTMKIVPELKVNDNYELVLNDNTIISKSLKGADAKEKIFASQPINSSEYNVGDLWINAYYLNYSNEILRCKVAKKEGELFSISHWDLASKYTDDTAANEAKSDALAAADVAYQATARAEIANNLLADIANDNKLTPQEKQDSLQEWNIIKSEKQKNIDIANQYGVSTSAYITTYNSLDEYITTTAIFIDLTTTSTIEGAFFRAKFKAYYEERTNLLNNIYKKAKEIADKAQETIDNLQIGGTNVAVTTSNEWSVPRTLIGNTNETYVGFCKKINIDNFSVDDYITISFDYQYENFEKVGAAAMYVQGAGNVTGWSNGELNSKKIENLIDWTTKTGIIHVSYHFKLTSDHKKNNSWAPHIRHNYITGNVSVKNFKAEKGTKETIWSPAPEDIQSSFNDLNISVNNTNKAITGLKNFTDTAFSDGLINRSEATAIEKYINSVNNTKQAVSAAYTQLYNNIYLEGIAKTNLLSAKTSLDTAINNLITSINTAITDGKTTAAEKTDVDSKFALFNTAYATFSTAIEAANKAIQDSLKGYSDAALAAANKAQADATNAKNEVVKVDGKVSDLNTYVDGAFKDGVISEAEAAAIEKYINSVNESKKANDALYIKLYANPYLEGTSKTGLSTAKTSLDTAIANLLSSINTAIKDGKTTTAEKADVDAKYALYSTALANLNTAIETANTAIQTKLKTYSDAAKSAAEEAKERLNAWAADGVIAPTEKQGIKDEIVRIDSDKNEITNGYAKYALGIPSSYNTAYTNYRAVLVSLSNATPEIITIPSDFATKQAAYYNERTSALSLISSQPKDNLESYKTEVKAEFTATNDKISGVVTSTTKYTDDQINNLQIGGVNLILNTNSIPKEGYWTLSGWSRIPVAYNAVEKALSLNAYNGWQTNSCSIPSTPKAIVSFEFKGSLNMDERFIRIGNDPLYLITHHTPVTSNWTKKSIKMDLSSGVFAIMVGGKDDSNLDFQVLIRNLKVESGDKETGWTPAPEDYDNKINHILGGTNILRGTNQGTKNWRFVTGTQGSTSIESYILGGVSAVRCKVLANQASWSNIRYLDILKEKLKKGIKYTISFDIISNRNIDRLSVSIKNDTNIYRFTNAAEFNSTTTLRRVSCILTPSSIQDSTNKFVQITTNSLVRQGDIIDIANIKLAEGDTDNLYSPAPEDVVLAAESAQSAASDAQGEANKANTAIADIASDNKLTPVEKSAERARWNEVSNEKPGINTQAVKYGLTVENASYNNSFQSLANYLNGGTVLTTGLPLWLSDAQLGIVTNIIGGTYRAHWNSYFLSRQHLLNTIYSKAKDLADNAQNSIDNLQIGGTNLLPDTEDYWENGWIHYEAQYVGSSYESIKAPVGVAIRLKDLLYIGSPIKIACKVHNTGYVYHVIEFNKDKKLIRGFGKAEPFIAPLNPATRYIAVYIEKKPQVTITPEIIREVRFKIEAGNRYSDYSPSIAKTVKESGFITDADGNTLFASKTDFDGDGTPLAEYLNIAEQTAEQFRLGISETKNGLKIAESNITANTKKIELKVSQTDFDDLGNVVSSHATLIDQSAQKIALIAGGMQGVDKSNIAIGTSNSGEWVSFTNPDYIYGGYCTRVNLKDLPVGSQVTISFDYQYNVLQQISGSSINIHFYGDITGNLFTHEVKILGSGTSGTHHISFTEYITADHKKNNYLTTNIRHQGVTGVIRVVNFKAERGDVETKWSLAPEDVSDRISNNEASIIVSDEKIALKIGEEESKKIAAEEIKKKWSGGINLLSGTNKGNVGNGASRWIPVDGGQRSFVEVNGVTAVSFNFPHPVRYVRFRLKEDQYRFTLNAQKAVSFDIICTLEREFTFFLAYFTDVSGFTVVTEKMKAKVPANTWTHVSDTFFFSEMALDRDISLVIGRDEGDLLANSNLKIKNLKIEEGFHSTGWQPSTEDFIATGIDITAEEISVTASKFKVQNNIGTPIAVFTTDSSGEPVLSAKNIDVENLSVKKLDSNGALFTKLVGLNDNGSVGSEISWQGSTLGLDARNIVLSAEEIVCNPGSFLRVDEESSTTFSSQNLNTIIIDDMYILDTDGNEVGFIIYKDMGTFKEGSISLVGNNRTVNQILIMQSKLSNRYKYFLSGNVNFGVRVTNLNNGAVDASTSIYASSGEVPVNGGNTVEFIYINPEILRPIPISTRKGRGWIVTSRYDYNW